MGRGVDEIQSVQSVGLRREKEKEASGRKELEKKKKMKAID